MTLIALSAVAAGVLTIAPVAQGSRAATPSLSVTFFPNGTITVTLPDGTPVGSTSGAPTVIPAGFYTVQMTGPGGCAQLPLFDLSGPGENIVDDMSGGEVTSEVHNATFLPNSTYTWRTDNVNPGIIHTFTTSGTAATTSGQSGSGAVTSTTPAPTSQDIVGSAITSSLGTLTGTVSAAGRLTLAYKGRSLSSLTPGRYTIVVTDRSASSGFLLEKGKHTVSITGAAYVGKRSTSVELTAGRWQVTPSKGKTAYSIVVG